MLQGPVFPEFVNPDIDTNYVLFVMKYQITGFRTIDAVVDSISSKI